MSKPKIHHYVPRFCLRGFADTDDRLAVRERQGRTYVTSTENVMARSGEYSVDHAPPTAEYTLADIDAMASSVLNKVRDGSLPRRGSSERNKLAIFMAVQIGRDLNAMPLLAFLSELFDRFDSSESGQIGIDDMRSYMTSK